LGLLFVNFLGGRVGYKYEDEELELNFKGQVVKFRAPSAREQQAVSKRFKEADENQDALDLYIEFFESLGISKEMTSQMSMKGIVELFSYAVGAKKN